MGESLMAGRMEEAEALMSDLQAFATTVQQCPPDELDHHRRIMSSSVYQIALNYSKDVNDLENLLPSSSALTKREIRLRPPQEGSVGYHISAGATQDCDHSGSRNSWEVGYLLLTFHVVY